MMDPRILMVVGASLVGLTVLSLFVRDVYAAFKQGDLHGLAAMAVGLGCLLMIVGLVGYEADDDPQARSCVEATANSTETP